ncbi:MAG: dTDP-4-amino-4,6-dideoxygalactose transaminase [Bacteroidetes bacterium]|nr:dTDP-4-amino-4,6-dideoxygalactose transaminase [Bacteroidota bacterium]
MIDFNRPYLTGKELEYIHQAVKLRKISGNGEFTRKCQNFFEKRYGLIKCLLTTSCTDALEMCALLIGIKEGDEVIVPSYTFVSTANAFVLRGARIVFADSGSENPNVDAGQIENLITSRTKALVVVHYAGVACDMDKIMKIAEKYKLYVIEDNAQGIDSFYNGKPLGSIGHLGVFSFHETKNIISGEGGMLVINDKRFLEKAEIIWEKGTNRAAFFRGETDKYGWVDIGSSFLPSEIIAAFLYAQLENLQLIQEKRREIWNRYYHSLLPLEKSGLLGLPVIPEYSTNNAHMFYLVSRNAEERTSLIGFLRKRGIYAVFHYLSLHQSPYYRKLHDGRSLPMADRYSDCLVRLPLFFELTGKETDQITAAIKEFYKNRIKK